MYFFLKMMYWAEGWGWGGGHSGAEPQGFSILCFMPQGALFSAHGAALCYFLLSKDLCPAGGAWTCLRWRRQARQALNLHAHVSTSWRRVPPDSGPGAPVGITATLGPHFPAPGAGGFHISMNSQVCLVQRSQTISQFESCRPGWWGRGCPPTSPDPKDLETTPTPR